MAPMKLLKRSRVVLNNALAYVKQSKISMFRAKYIAVDNFPRG